MYARRHIAHIVSLRDGGVEVEWIDLDVSEKTLF